MKQVWYVPNGAAGRYVAVLKVGHRLLHLEGGLTAERATMLVRPRKGSASRGQCWLTQTDYQRWLSRHAAWRHLRRQVQDRWTAPETVTLEQMQAASDLLRLAAWAA